MKHAIAISCVLSLFSIPAAFAQPKSELRKLFRREADILVEYSPSKLVQLELPTEILSACQADLSDVRVLDRNEQEVPVVIDRGTDQPSTSALKQTIPAKIVHAESRQVGRPHGPPDVKEVYELEVPKHAPESGHWDLLFQTSRSHFVRRVDIEVITGQKATAVLERGAIFRLPRADGEQVQVSLPAALGEKIRVTLSGEDQLYLEPKFVFESTRKFAQRTQAIVPLVETKREKRDGKTVIELARPSGIVPSVLRLKTATPAFDRLVEVHDIGPGGRDIVLGSTPLFRVDTIAPVENLDLKLSPAMGDRLRVEISDGDSPTLEELSFSAVIRQPRLIFALPKTENGAYGTLLFGGGRAHRPKYDVAGLLPAEGTTSLDKRAQAAASLFSPDMLRKGRIEGIRPNSGFDPSPALAFAAYPGTNVNARLYSHQRPLQVAKSPDVLSRVRIDAADLANVRPDFADIRIIDAESRQWPYLLERDEEQQWLDVRVQKPESKKRSSYYQLDFPVTPVGFDRLSIASTDPYFDRAYRVVGTDLEGNEVTLAQGRLVQGGATVQLPVVELTTAPRRVREAKLIVEDGENAPLAISAVRARVSLPVLYLAANPGAYTLLLGNPDDSAPVYDITRVRDLVLAVASVPSSTGPLTPNASYSRRSRWTTEHTLLWGSIGVAVLGLGAFTLRLARREAEQSSGSPK